MRHKKHRFPVVLALVVGVILGLPYLFSRSFTPPHCQHDADNLRCVNYVSNHDGDSIRFRIRQVHPVLGDGVLVNVRGVRAPSIFSEDKCEKQRARKARRLVKRFLKRAEIIHLENIYRRKSSRILADVMADGKSLRRFLIKRGLAYPDNERQIAEVDWCRKSTQATP